VKKKLILMGIAGGLIATTIIGGTLAATSIKSQTGNTEAEITVDNLSINLQDGAQNSVNELRETVSSNDLLEDTFVVPNASIEYNQLVHNSGDYPVYIRVTIEKAWSGEFVEREPDLSYIELDYNTNDWIAFPSTSSQASLLEEGEESLDINPLVLYYKYPVTINNDTSQFLNTIHLSSMIDEAYSNAQISISVTAEAVQSLDAKNAIPSEWGVFPELGGTDGTEILSISDSE
jgi:hypothetical protein